MKAGTTIINTSIEEQEALVKQAYARLRLFLDRYHWGVLPRRGDPEARAFWSDVEAVQAINTYHKEYGRLNTVRHRESRVAYDKAWYQNNREHKRATDDAWRVAHPEVEAKQIVWIHNWQRAHIQNLLDASHRRRMRLNGVEGTHTHEEFEVVCKEFEYKCIYCGRSSVEAGRLTEDHLTPITRGGSDWIDNIVPACKSCNSSKGDKTFEEYIEWLGKQEEMLDGRAASTSR